jgi:hypothetical protein
MSQFRVEKRRVEAELTLATGATRRGCFFLAGSNPRQAGPERVGDLLNAESGFFPFDTNGPSGPETVLINRAHVVYVRLAEHTDEARRDAGYELATERHVTMVLSNGDRLDGAVRVFCPQGRDRLSDYARSQTAFRYLESRDATFVVNSSHIVELTEESGGGD